MRIYATLVVATLSLTALSCSDGPTQPQPDAISPDQELSLRRGRGGHGRANALTEVPVTMPAKFVPNS